MKVEELAEKIAATVKSALEDGSADRQSVRQVIVGPSKRGDLLQIWVSDRWEDYGEPDADGVIGSLSNSEWLDAIDASELVPGAAPAEKQKRDGLRHVNPGALGTLEKKRRELRADLIAALRIVGARVMLGETKNLVGLMVSGLSNSGYADLVAFHHPHGDGELLPVHEHLEPDTDVYSRAALRSEGLTMFYPEGDEDSLSDKKAASASRTYRFDEMASWRADDDEVRVRLKGDLFDVRFTHGHCNEEWGEGFLSQSQVDEKLVAHFRKNAAALFFDPGLPPNPDDTKDFAAWLSALQGGGPRTRAGISASGAVNSAMKRFGASAAKLLVSKLPQDPEILDSANVALAEALLEAGKPRDALAIFDGLPEKTRKREWREELTALVTLGHYEETVTRAHEIASADKELAEDVLPFTGLALVGLGYAKDAVTLLSGRLESRDSGRRAFALAVALQSSDPARARASLFASLEDGSRFLDPFGSWIKEPALREILEKRAALKAQAASHGGYFPRIVKKVDAPLVPFDELAARSAAPIRWEVAAKIPRAEKARGNFKGWELGETDGWIAAGEGGVARAALADLAAPDLTECGITGSIQDVALNGRWLYGADWNDGLVVIDTGAPRAPQKIFTAPRYDDDSRGSVATNGRIVALAGNPGVSLFDLTDPAHPVEAGFVGVDGMNGGYAEDVLLCGDILYVSVMRAGLLVVDVSDPHAPRLLSILDGGGEEMHPGELELLGDLLLVKTSAGRWILDVSEPADPQSLAVIPQELRFECAAKAGTGLLVLDDQQRVWTVDLSDRAKPKILHAASVAAKDERRPIEDPAGLCFADGKLVVLGAKALYVLNRAPLRARPDPKPAVVALEPKISEWLDAQLAAVPAGFVAGMAVIEQWGNEFTLTLDAPRSFVGVEFGPVLEEAPRFTLDLTEITSKDVLPRVSGEAPEDLDEGAQELWTRALWDAWKGVIDRMLESIPARAAFARIACGRLHLVRRGPTGVEIVRVVSDSSRPWRPFRTAPVERRVRTLDELLADFEHLDRMKERAKTEEVVRAAAYSAAAKGVLPAMRVVDTLLASDPERAIPAMIAATKGGYGDQAIDSLGALKDRPDVKACLEGWLRVDAPAPMAIAAAAALGRIDDDVIVALAKTLLDKPDGDYNDADSAAEACKLIDTRIAELRPSLTGWMDRARPRDNRIPAIAVPLFRSGHPTLPEKLVEVARSEKNGEEYHSMKTGIRALDEHEWEQNEACYAERLWTGKTVADRVITLMKAFDDASPLWPPELPLEKHHASWGYLLHSALPHLDKAGAFDWFEQHLVMHAKPGDAFAGDRSMLTRMIDQYIDTNDLVAAMRLAEGVLSSPDGTFDKKLLERIRSRQGRVKVAKGFQLVQARKIPEARAICNELLAVDATDGQTLFLDARIVWFEKSVEAAIERAKVSVEKVDDRDSAGKGRLLNLIGCGLDELKRWPEAVEWFERAATTHGEDPMYLANLAEIHDKLGNEEEAVRWAKQARRKRVKSDVVDRILAAAATAKEDAESEDEDEDVVDLLAGDDDDEETEIEDGEDE